MAVLESPPYPWEDEMYLKPVVDGDALLQYDFDGDEESSDRASPSKQYVTSPSHVANYRARGF